MTAFPVLLIFPLSFSQHIIPIPSRWSKAEPLASDVLSYRPQPLGIGIALWVGVRRRNELRVGAGYQTAQRLGRLRRPATTGAEIKRTFARAFDCGQAHRVDGRFGDTEALGARRAEAKQDLRSARCEAAPFGSPLLPTNDGPSLVSVRGPHAADRPLSEQAAVGRRAKDRCWERTDQTQVLPGLRPGPWAPASLPPVDRWRRFQQCRR